MKHFLERNAKHLVIVGGLLCVQFFIRDIVAAHRQHIVRRRLVARGAKTRENVQAARSDLGPEDCDLVLTSNVGDVSEATYYHRRGSMIATVHTRGGRWLATDNSYTGNKASFLLPIAAFVTLAAPEILNAKWLANRPLQPASGGRVKVM